MSQTSIPSKSEYQFLAVAGILVLLLGAPTVGSLLREPQPSVVVQSMSSGNRLPSSIGGEPQASSIGVSDSVSTSLEVSCNQQFEQKVTAGHVRLTGVSCKGFQGLSITNQTNGFSAAVIFTKNKKFTTDFIDLKEGENLVELKSLAKDGTEKIQSLKIIRRVPASAASSK